METYQSYLFAAVLPIVGNPDAAQDVLQEAFLQAHRSLSSYRGPNLRSWLARIAVNKAVDWRRAVGRLSSTINALTVCAAQSAAHPSPEDEFLTKSGYASIAEAVDRLPPAYKDVFLQRYAEEKDCKSIASSEGISVRTVESRLYRARRMLKEALRQG